MHFDLNKRPEAYISKGPDVLTLVVALFHRGKRLNLVEFHLQPGTAGTFDDPVGPVPASVLECAEAGKEAWMILGELRFGRDTEMKSYVTQCAKNGAKYYVAYYSTRSRAGRVFFSPERCMPTVDRNHLSALG